MSVVSKLFRLRDETKGGSFIHLFFTFTILSSSYMYTLFETLSIEVGKSIDTGFHADILASRASTSKLLSLEIRIHRRHRTMPPYGYHPPWAQHPRRPNTQWFFVDVSLCECVCMCPWCVVSVQIHCTYERYRISEIFRKEPNLNTRFFIRVCSTNPHN